MSMFKVNVTPTRQQNIKKRDEAREPTIVVFAPFTPKSIVTFDCIPVTKTARRFLLLQNPSQFNLQVEVTKTLKPDLNAQLEWTKNVIQSESSITLEIVWNPIKQFSGLEKIEITDDRGCKKDISIILKSIDNNVGKKVVVKKPLNQHNIGSLSKKKLKTPSPKKFPQKSPNLQQRKRQHTSNLIQTKWKQKNNERIDEIIIDVKRAKQIQSQQLFELRSEQNFKEISNSMFETFEMSKIDDDNNIMLMNNHQRINITENKENKSPNTPNNVSALFDKIQFTPATETKTKGTSTLDYLASLPTPVSVLRNDTNNKNQIDMMKGRRIFISPENYNANHLRQSPKKTSILRENNLNDVNKDNTMLTPIPLHLLTSTVNDTVKSVSSFEPPSCSTIGKTLKKLNTNQIIDSEDIRIFTDSNRKLFELSQNELFDENKIQNDSLERLSSETYIKSPTCFDEIIETCTVSTQQHDEIEIITTTTTTIEEYQRYETINVTSSLNKTDTVIQQHIQSQQQQQPLSMIAEESTNEIMGMTFVDKRNLEQTFHIGGNDDGGASDKQVRNHIKSDDCILLNSIYPNTTPLRKLTSESLYDLSCENLLNVEQKCLKFNQGSMPNLNDIELINSIENNRYYKSPTKTPKNQKFQNDKQILVQDSIKNNIDFVFRENEICAQSSRFNLHEIDGLQTTNSLSNLSMKTKQWNEIDNRNNQNSKIYYAKNPRESQQQQQQHLRTSIISPMRPSKSENLIRPSKNVIMTMSPPNSRNIIRNNQEKCTVDQQGQTIRTTKWGTTLSKKVKIPKVPIQQLVLKKKIPPLKRQESKENNESERIVLFDPDLFLHGVINPDPFAATTTDDPFLAATMYLDQRSIDNHEKQFKKWLNALVTIPDDGVTEKNLKIDFGRLFQDAQNSKLTLAPTRETVSTNYFTKYRMISLRKLAMQLFHSEQLRSPLSKLAALVEKKMIAIRDDRDLHLDLVLQRNILEILLCFNPLWLRIGLEVVFGELIPLQSNSDIIGLSQFIIQRLFRDKYLESKNTRNFLQSEIYSDQIKIFSLKKLLFLLLFLDAAKTNKIIKHNPCLFVKNSQFKETKDVLLKITSTLVANFGDITKYLKRLGYVLNHKQTYLDEFDYAFQNIAVDLRDGVRLTRVIEIILLRDDMSKNLRVPAISRLQRVHNVDIALKALADANFLIKGDITAKDIADGHREKTLSLLWQIIYKFRAPKFKAAATIIQNWWRKSWLSVIIKRRIVEKYEIKRNLSAIKIQSYFRGFICRKIVTQYKTKIIQSTLIIQKTIKRYQVQKKFKQLKKSAIIIQRWWKCTIEMRQVRSEYLTIRNATIYIQCWYRRIKLARQLIAVAPIIKELKLNAKIQYMNAIIIQRTLKSYVIRKRLRETVYGIVRFNRQKYLKNNCAKKLQSYYKMWKLNKEYLLLKKSTLIIQRKFRTIQMRREYLKQKENTILIQRYIRNYLTMKRERNEFLLIRKTTIYIQQKFRANLQMKIERNLFMNLKMATIKIQHFYRATIEMRMQRDSYLRLKKSVIKIQQHFRGMKLMQMEQCNYLILKNSVEFIQILFRANKQMKFEKNNYLKIRKSVQTIQIKYRAIKLMHIERTRYQTLKTATIILQQRYRAKLQMELQRNEFIRQKQLIIFIQNLFKANLKMKIEKLNFIKLKMATILIQQHLRATLQMKHDRNMYLQLVKSAICIQQHYRANCLMKQLVHNYKQQKHAAIVIQQRYRANCLMKHNRKNYLKLKVATIKIQQIYGGRLKMKNCHNDFIVMRKSVICIQKILRSYLIMKTTRKTYVELRQTTIFMQRKIRNYLSMKRERNEFLLIRKTTIYIQQKFRANLQMKIERNLFIKLKMATIKIQRFYRATIEMRMQRDSYLRLKRSVIKIQQHFRGMKLMRMEQCNYLILKNSVEFIQILFRANIQMKFEKNNYLKIRKSVQTIQIKYRAIKLMHIERTRYQTLKKATIILQQRYRAKRQMELQRNEFIRQKQLIIFIQNLFKANLKMKIEKLNFIKLKMATIVIQQHLRATLQMKHDRNMYLQLVKSAICIQQHYRANCLMNQLVHNYKQQKHAAIVIQQRYRANCLMKHNRTNFLKLKVATIKIQQIYRGRLKMKNCHNDFIVMRKSVICIQKILRSYLIMKSTRKSYVELRQTTIFVQRKIRSSILMRTIRHEYVQLKTVTITIQQRFRANQLMKLQRCEYLLIRNKTILIQQKLKATLMMREQRKSYLELRQSSIVIQQRFRALISMRYVRDEYLQKRKTIIYLQSLVRCKRECAKYLKIKTATILIQHKLRSTIMMHNERNNYLKLIKSTIIIQRHFRANILMKYERSKYLILRENIIKIQRYYRAQLLMRKIRNQYLLIRCLIICIQRKFRANRLMLNDRDDYLKLRNTTIFIQQKYRGKFLMQRDRQKFLELKEFISKLQTRIRGTLSRQNYQKIRAIKLTPEVLELRRQQKAAKKIQSFWRGHCVRKRLSKKMRIICHNVIKLKNPHKTLTLGYKLKISLKFLRGTFYVPEAISVLIKLDNMSRVVPHILIDDSHFIAKFCYTIMSRAIRSEPDKQLIELCSRVILNLARFNQTCDYAFQEEGLVTIAQMLLRWCDKECGIFNTLCTLIWVFSHNNNKKKKIREFMAHPEAIFFLRETKLRVLRKDKMRKNDKRPFNIKACYSKDTDVLPSFEPDYGKNKMKPLNTNSSIDTDLLPSLEPDFGIIKKQPYKFNNPVNGFYTILEKLDFEI